MPGWTSATTRRYEDGLQLAHCTRMLEACGHHAGPEHRWGAVLGTSRIEVPPRRDPQWMFVWHDLDERLDFTFSRSRGKVRRSLLERYGTNTNSESKSPTTLGGSPAPMTTRSR